MARAAHSNRQALTAPQLTWAYEHAMLKATVAWELFLENALALYVVGERAPSGRLYARRKRITGGTVRQVRITFRGDSEFVSWLSVEAVSGRAEEWLRDGGPFSNALASAGSPLAYVRILRNAIAHNSDAAWEKFEEKTRRLYGSVPRSLSPGSQLSAAPAASLGLPGPTLFEGTVALFRALSSQITP